MIAVSDARADDAPSIALLHLHAATTAYRGILPPEAKPPTLGGLEIEWQGAIADPDTSVLVARRQEVLLGVVIVRAEPGVVGTAQLSRLYVRPESWDQGIGGGLHDTALARARKRGYSTIALWVLEHNERARRFYETKGWSLVEGQLLEWPKLAVREVRYELAMSP